MCNKICSIGLKDCLRRVSRDIGGTCLNVGSIPSKSLLNLSENYHNAKKEFNNLGIETKSIKLNLSKMMINKNNLHFVKIC